jgi:hypothetical protein
MKTFLMAIGCVAMLAAAPYASAQPAGAPQSAPDKPGTIRGRITAADNGKPLRRARVTLSLASGAPARISQAATTNGQGTFEIKDVPPGAYFVSASRSGHLTLQHGQRRPGERGLAVEVKPGDVANNINVVLPRGSVVAGRVLDELGEPYPGIRVSANEIRYLRGQRQLFPAGSALTDDLGRYRIPGLVPGPYLVSAVSNETWKNEKKETLAYAVTYYPGGTAEASQPVTLAVAQERIDVDFALFVSRTVLVSGRVQQPSGEPLIGEPVSLARSLGGSVIIGEGIVQVRTTGDGAFEFRDVPPADYMIRTSGRSGTASIVIPVAGDVENLLLVPRTGSSVTGSVVTESGGPPPFPVASTRVLLVAAEEGRVLPTVRAPAIERDWSFTLSSVGGPFVFRLQGLPTDWMIDAVKVNETDITDVAFDVPTGGRDVAGLQIVITKEIATIRGEVITADGKPTPYASVIAFADNDALWLPGSRFVRMTRPDTSGKFSISGLPGGAYFIVALDSVIEGQWEDPQFLESVRKAGTRVTLSRGGTESVSLKLP